ncbi:MAG: DNA-binding protein [Gammaproteobacteria bacterium]|nr:DNA-binding protein [Gammaproteobacteria bacterium]
MAEAKSDAFSADLALALYWEAARASRLLLKHCRDCGKTHYYPRPLCVFCMSANTDWLEAAGVGTIYSWSVERRATPPYAIAFVTLPEGPTLLTAIVDCDLDALAIGQHVTLGFETREGQPVPVFRPA